MNHSMPDTYAADDDVHTRSEDLTVIILNDFCYVQGGASKVAIDDAIGLAAAGLRVIFIGAVGPVCAELGSAPLKVVCLGQPELLDVRTRPSILLQGLWNFEAGRCLSDELASLRPDRTVIHLHGYTKALTVSPVRAAKKLGFKVVCTLHDFFPACPNGAFFDYRRGEPCTRRALSSGCITANCDKRRYAHKIFRVARGVIQRGLGKFPGAVEQYIYLSCRSKEILAPYLPAQARLRGLENAIDWPRPPKVEASGNQTILYVGRLDQEKGVLLLAQAAAELGLKVLFVGDGPMRSKIENDMAMPVVGWVSRTEVRHYLASARCLVFPSLWYETYGLVVSEASAHGIPVIASNVTAAAERIEDNITGWLFRSGDMADLVRCLKFIENDTRVSEVGGAAYRAFWETATTATIHADRLTSIYRSILAG
ncbi:MAG: glycosyltransferase [Rhodospirillaceae bacterium]|nr:MAG: glycosyltransferase [Rhodospirillaceae bacterium]